MSKSYNKNSLLSSPNVNIFNNLFDKSLSLAPYLPLSFIKFISFISTSLLQSESIILSDLASIIAPLKDIALHSAKKYITRSLNNPNYDFHHFYFKFINSLMSSFKIKHPDNKVVISLDHMYVEDRLTILMFINLILTLLLLEITALKLILSFLLPIIIKSLYFF